VWTAPSVNDDRLAEQVVGSIGGSGIDVWFQHRKRTGKDAWNRKVSGVFFCF
jgi:nitrite reductase (NADH) large subunit